MFSRSVNVWMNLRVSKEEFVRAESLGQQVHALGSISVQLKTTRQTQKDKTGSKPEASVYRLTISVKGAGILVVLKSWKQKNSGPVLLSRAGAFGLFLFLVLGR